LRIRLRCFAAAGGRAGGWKGREGERERALHTFSTESARKYDYVWSFTSRLRQRDEFFCDANNNKTAAAAFGVCVNGMRKATTATARNDDGKEQQPRTFPRASEKPLRTNAPSNLKRKMLTRPRIGGRAHKRFSIFEKNIFFAYFEGGICITRCYINYFASTHSSILDKLRTHNFI
jgi:hypothetical protein